VRQRSLTRPACPLLIAILLPVIGLSPICSEEHPVEVPGTISPYDADILVERRIALPSGEHAVVIPAYRSAGGADDSATSDEPSLAFVIAVLDHADTMVLQPVALSADFDLDALPPAGHTAYMDQALISQEHDFNSDGNPDILINQGPVGCYGGAMYHHFLSAPDGRYRSHPGLDRLADMHCFIAPEAETGLIMAVDPRDGTSSLYTWYRCDEKSCEKVRERVER
jgi:hypothetical protein